MLRFSTSAIENKGYSIWGSEGGWTGNFADPPPIFLFFAIPFPCLYIVVCYSLPQKKVYTFVEPSTQNWEELDEK